jgi:DNA-binding GntR family transcriptional regulator
VEIVRSLRQGSRLYGLRELPDDSRAFASFHEHAELLDLIAARDAAGAEALMRRHIGHVRGVWADPSAAERE